MIFPELVFNSISWFEICNFHMCLLIATSPLLSYLHFLPTYLFFSLKKLFYISSDIGWYNSKLYYLKLNFSLKNKHIQCNALTLRMATDCQKFSPSIIEHGGCIKPVLCICISGNYEWKIQWDIKCCLEIEYNYTYTFYWNTFICLH